MQKEAGTGEVRPSWIRKLQQQQEGTQQNKQKGNDPKQENKEKGRQESKKKAQSNIPKKKKPPLVKETETKPATSSKEAKEKVKIMEEKAVDGKNLRLKKTDLDYEQLIFIVFHSWKQRSPGNIKGTWKNL